MLNISMENSEHLIRTFRSFLEGFALLVNNNAFGNPISIEKSFDISLQVLITGIKTFKNKEVDYECSEDRGNVAASSYN